MEAKNMRYLPDEYRECADEDGAIRKYRIPIHEPSFKAGQKAERERIAPLVESLFEMIGWGDYSNGNEYQGFDEGRVRSGEHLERLEAQWQALKEGYENT